MAKTILHQVRAALANLNPDDVRQKAERDLRVQLVGASEAGLAAMEDFLSPPGVSKRKRWEIVQALHHGAAGGGPFDIEIYEEGLPRPKGGFWFSVQAPGLLVDEILAAREDVSLALARTFPPFRPPVVQRVMQTVSRENALFALATALPNIIPTLAHLPWVAGEFASDTVLLTVNQVRMAFLLAGASDRAIGYREQRAEIGSIIAGAFGWRALARELGGKIPLGAGLIPKAAIAYAGTYVVGLSLERLYRIGYGYSRAERRQAYESALARGKEVAAALLDSLKLRRAG